MLVDDVLTSGGHIRACAAFLRDHGCVAGAVCAGKADNSVVGLADAFHPRVDQMEDFNDDPSWSIPVLPTIDWDF